jgi:hypothetical protein
MRFRECILQGTELSLHERRVKAQAKSGDSEPKLKAAKKKAAKKA